MERGTAMTTEVLCSHLDTIREVTPSADGCEDCLKIGDSWVHLRLCLSCGHVGCCDSSKNTHATKHFHASHYPIVQSFQPDEDWLWCYVDEVMMEPGELFELGHIVAGDDDGDRAFAIELANERQNAPAREDVEAKRGLVEQQDLGLVQQRQGQIGAHALTETELARQGAEDVVEVEQLAHQAEHPFVARARDVPDDALPLEAGGDRVIPPQLGPLAEDHADA